MWNTYPRGRNAEKNTFQSLAIFVISFQFSLPHSLNRKITNTAWLWFQHSKYWYYFHIEYRKELKVVLYKQSEHSHVWNTGRKQYYLKKKKNWKVAEGQGREKKVNFPNSAQLGSYCFSPRSRGGIKRVGLLSFQEETRNIQHVLVRKDQSVWPLLSHKARLVKVTKWLVK